MDMASDRGLTIKEAAARLGITDVAVRKRLIRGKLPGYKDETGQWFVHLPDDLPPVDPAKATGTALSTDPGSRQVIARLEDEVRYLRDELRRERENRNEELRRKDVLLAEFSQRLTELTQRLPEIASSTGEPTPLLQGEKPAHAWWQFWKTA
jgi:excisionase family DNA binding protein